MARKALEYRRGGVHLLREFTVAEACGGLTVRGKFDGGWRVQGVEALGGDRYRFRGADMVITVSSRTTFTDEHGDRHTHCPTGQIPRSEREDWGDLWGR